MRLRHYLYIVSLAALSACNSEELNTSDTADGEIRLSAATIEGSTAVTTRTITPGSPKALTEGTAIALQVSGTWTKESSSETVVKTPTATAAASTTTANSLTLNPSLYWDDFGTADPANATTGRTSGLTIYGVAIDGVTTAPEVTSWTSLTWDLGAVQTGGISAKDLLLSNNVSGTNTYKFSDSRKQLEFKHVLSKITVNILAGEGFDGKFTNDPVVVLTSNEANSTTNAEWAYTSGTFDVTTGKLDESSLIRNAVTMAQVATAATNYTVTKEALVMPGSTFASDAATIMRINADGNIYYITAEKIRTAIDATDHANGTAYPTKAGKNYIFKVRVNKTGVEVTATVKDWDTVDSEQETPAISFTADVTSSTNTTTGSNLSNDASLKSGDSFSLWMSTDKSSFGSIATTATYNADDSKFVNSPTIYWPNSSTSYYFRALAQKTDTHTLEAVTTTAVSQGTDLLWGTTAAHTGTYSEGSKEYAESAIINPRTGAVPLIFKHAMSNVVVELSTSTDAASAVVLKDAKVTLTNLNTEGTINIADGVISSKTPVEQAFSGKVDDTDHMTSELMMPQTIGNTSKLIVTLADGTTYSLQLNTCTNDASSTAIASWVGGSKYTYKIYLEKEAMKFSVTITGWDPVYGSGNATLDWD
ncbi:Fimbrillin-like [Xylanibacter ruminicola]|uniref:Fimbrillin-like n=1 Tax=Xylanibacter ruminicola TaxID=839 RepID=A0A1H3ZUQ8_XYLRU|nr:fimbrillin family protein [Xylanibacter ruminicola]SEA27438.1 Fimbrillin-like [Xylanibacter ruminicola]